MVGSIIDSCNSNVSAVSLVMGRKKLRDKGSDNGDLRDGRRLAKGTEQKTRYRGKLARREEGSLRRKQ